ncbi:MAG TPA: glutaredoxin family protein [Pseudomonadales bacterium]
MAASLYLYGTAGCHLCEQAEALLEPFVRAGVFRFEVIDISTDDALVERYGIRIPVLAVEADGRTLELGWPFDQAQVWSWWSQASLMCQGS